MSTGSLFIRLADAPAPVVALWRTALATLILLPFGLRKAVVELRGTGGRELLGGVSAGAFLALHFASWIASLDHTTVAASTTIVCTTPIWVALAGPLVASERVGRATLLGIAVAVAGAVLIAGGDRAQGSMLGNLLALVGALSAAGYVLLGRRLRPRVSLLTHVLVTYGTAALVLAALVLGQGLAVFGHSPETYLWLVLLALVPQLIGHTGYNYALRYERASFVSVVMLGEPIAATLLAWWLLAERPGAEVLVGGAVVLVGIALVARARPGR